MARLLFLQDFDYEFMGPMYVAAAARRRGHRVDLKLGRTMRDFRRAIESFKPDVVGFSVMTGTQGWALDVARRVKKEYGIGNVFGGAHPTFFPGFLAEEGVDAIVVGEGEDAACDLLDRVDAKRDFSGIRNVHHKSAGTLERNEPRDLPSDLDVYAFPDRSLYRDLDGRTDRSVRNVITSRGCPFDCSFCFEEAMREMYKGRGKYVRIRRMDRVLEELSLLKKEGGVRTIFFCDDLFGMDKPWLYEFLPLYRREVGLPFTCQVRADIVASDERYARALKDGLCSSVSMGVESGNEDLRNRVLDKQLTNAQILRAADYLHRAGVPFRTYNIMGLPGETLEDALSTVELNIAIKADYPWCSIFSPLPGTRLTQYALERGDLAPGFEFAGPALPFFAVSQLTLDHSREIQNLQRFFQTACVFPWSLPLIKRLIRLPRNPLFNAWFGAVYLYFIMKVYRMRLRPTLVLAARNLRKALEL